MNKKLLICGSAIAVVVLVLASLSPVVGYNSVESSVKVSPLFNIRTKRAIDKETDALTCEYIGKGYLLPFPIRNSKTVLIQNAINRISRMDDTAFNRFMKLVISHAQRENKLEKEDLPKLKTAFHRLRDNPDLLKKYDLIVDEDDIYTLTDGWNPGCILYYIAVYIGAFIVISLFVISIRWGCITVDWDCNPCLLRSPLTM